VNQIGTAHSTRRTVIARRPNFLGLKTCNQQKMPVDDIHIVNN